jgi:hypothetical protein
LLPSTHVYGLAWAPTQTRHTATMTVRIVLKLIHFSFVLAQTCGTGVPFASLQEMHSLTNILANAETSS